VRPAPSYDPPYDEDRPAGWWPPDLLQPLLELPGLAGAGWPASPPGPADQGPGPDRRSRPARPAAGPPPAASPPTVAAAARFVNTCLEILNGYRPVAHFRSLSDPLAAAEVLAEMTRAVRRLRPTTRQPGLVKLRAMRTCEPRPGVAEIALVVGVGVGVGAGGAGRPAGAGPAAGGDRRAAGGGRTGRDARVWALAFRLECQHGRWQCTAAQLLI
jgi:hypothetical protein